eukprot:363700-Chlamydomonas_euryale.AAC.5
MLSRADERHGCSMWLKQQSATVFPPPSSGGCGRARPRSPTPHSHRRLKTFGRACVGARVEEPG